MNLLPELFLTFAKIGLFTFGGGYAMVALIENTCVEKKKWITQDEMMGHHRYCGVHAGTDRHQLRNLCRI